MALSVFVSAHVSAGAASTHDSQSVHRFEPLNDSRWSEFLQRHPRSSVFHTVAWLDALRRTYGYEPVAITTSPPGTDLRNAIVLCRVESWLTGRRLVALPFSDHCDVLAGTATNFAVMISALEEELRREKLRYVELRPTHVFNANTLGPHCIYTYCSHQVDLRPDLDKLFGNLHKSSTQRKIRRAEREGLTCAEGRSAFVLDSFYRLWLLTRRRHRMLPQPKRWFQNLIDCFGQALKIRVAFKGEQPIAAVLTLRHKDTLVYKYGCSDAHFHNLGGMHLLLWRSIQEAKQDGLTVFDLGRSEWGASGLITFKDRWGAKRSVLTYLRLVTSQSKEAFIPLPSDWKERTAKKAASHLPDYILSAVGNVLCRHIG